MTPTTIQPTQQPITETPTNTQSPINTNPPIITTNSPINVFPTFQPIPISPTINPTPSPTQTEIIKQISSTSYTVVGCWGIDYSKKYIDSAPIIEYNSKSFNNYINTKFLNQTKYLCEYINNNRNYYNINPIWNITTDCLYNQLVSIQHSQSYLSFLSQTQIANTVSTLILYWGQTSKSNTQLVGIDSTTQQPIWICTNISALSQVSSFLTNTKLAETLIIRWTKLFQKYTYTTTSSDSNMNIPTIVGSSSFALAVLAAEVLKSIELAGIISICGFVGLILLFTCFHITETIIGTLIMVAIMFTTICLHLWFFNAVIDLLDIVVIIAIIGMIVDLPVSLFFV